MNKEKIKQMIITTSIVILTIIFFSYNIVICIDSSHYCWLASLMGKNGNFAEWDVARGIVFPLIIYILTGLIGKNVISLQIGMYIAYATVLLICYLIYRDLNKEYQMNKLQKISIGLLAIFLIILNPLIFGYYHTILTEFIAMTACITISYITWKWVNTRFTENKIKYILLTIYFALSMVFMWHLKQPYVLTVFAPVLIGTVLAIIKEFNWKNIIQRLVTVLTCVITLIISLKVWDFTLDIANVNVDDSRTSSAYLSSQLLSGMSEYTVITDKEEYKIDNIKNNKKISQEDKEKIELIINEKNQQYQDFLLIDCAPYRDLNNSKEIKVIYMKDEILSVGEALKFGLDMFIQNPRSIIEGYFNNYLTTIGLYRGQTVGVNSTVTKEVTFSGTYENNYIACNIYRDTVNNLNIPEHYEKYIENYNGINRQIKFINVGMLNGSVLAIYEFKLSLLIVPILFVATFIIYIVLKVKKAENSKLKIYEILTILYGYSFLNVLMYSVLGGLIDRYAISSYLAVNIGLIIHFVYISTLIINYIKNHQNKSEKA